MIDSGTFGGFPRHRSLLDVYDYPAGVFTSLAVVRSSGGRDAGGCAIQDELDRDPHLVFAIQRLALLSRSRNRGYAPLCIISPRKAQWRS